ncbi:MAG: 30S ribosomal protein S12 methylthiotransferase RimO [Bacteroidales bacterium]|nr:30S ribosomal protein S12 methylthiotransferase RimO [Bacteroidales bacterium]
MQKVRIITLGCSKNTVDTEHILAQLEGSFEIVPEGDDRTPVDYLLLNTCGFISDAKEESIQAVLEAVELKKRGLAGKVIAFGCLSQRYAAEMPGLIPEVDAWYGARDLDEVPRALGVTPSAEKATRRYPTAPGPAYAFLKISEGCDRRCSYCAIPLIRGKHRSVPMEALVEEAEMLAAKGVKELILIAQDSTYYGLDLYGERKLAELIRRLSAIDRIEWIRIHYSYPDGFPLDTLDEIATNPKVCKYLDIPLQHIADGVLSKMHRGIDGAGTRALVRRLRETVPDVVLRTTMIVGHPGEGEAEFEELLDFLREVRFERLGAFTYSEEEDTYDARHYPDEVPEEEKKRRLDALMSLQGEISLAFNQSRVGTVERVLVDAYSDGVLVCRSRCESPEVDGEILVKADVPAPEALVGRMIDVRIDGADEYDLIASMI